MNMPDGDGGTIVVTGRREQQSDGTFIWTFLRSGSGTPGIREVMPNNVSENPEAPLALEITIAIERTNLATSEEAMIAAAKALAQAVARALDALKAADPNRVVAVNGVAVSVGTLLNALQNTGFTVSDRPDLFWANGGVGAAQYSPLGQHRSTISYRAIGGDPADPSAGYYNHPNFEGRGMLALALHEAFHLTPQGFEWYNRNADTYTSRYGATAPYSGALWEPYARNTERLINQMALAAMAAVDDPHVPSQPPFEDMEPPVDPSSIP
jgi:hypothetical protein